MSEQLSFVMPQIDGETPDELAFKIAGKCEGIYRPLRRNERVLLLLDGHVTTIAQTERYEGETVVVVRTATIGLGGLDDMVYRLDRDAIEAAGATESDLFAAAKALQRRDQDRLSGQEPLPFAAYLEDAKDGR